MTFRFRGSRVYVLGRTGRARVTLDGRRYTLTFGAHGGTAALPLRARGRRTHRLALVAVRRGLRIDGVGALG